jgi:hypothetical protein
MPLEKQSRITLPALAGILRRALAGWWNDNVPRRGASQG